MTEELKEQHNEQMTDVLYSEFGEDLWLNFKSSGSPDLLGLIPSFTGNVLCFHIYMRNYQLVFLNYGMDIGFGVH